MKTKNNFYVLDDEETLIKFSNFKGSFEELKTMHREFSKVNGCFYFYRNLKKFLKCDIEIITEIRRF